MSCCAIIQARVGSTRLPMKSLLFFREAPLVDWVVTRVSMAARIDRVIVALPDTPMNDILEDHLLTLNGKGMGMGGRTPGFDVVRGPEDDVLARFLMAAERVSCDHVVRVCADNPLIWGGAIDRLVDDYLRGGADYCYNHVPRANLWPDGLGAEILSRDLLREIGKKARKPSQREHCLNFVWDNAPSFRIRTFDPVEPWLRRPEVKLDIDTPEDFCRLARMRVSMSDGPRAVLDAWDARDARNAEPDGIRR